MSSPTLNKDKFCDNERELLEFLMTSDDLKFNLSQSCAFLACVEHASNFDHTKNLNVIDDKWYISKDYESTGICGWKNRSIEILYRLSYTYNNSRMDLRAQKAFILRELSAGIEDLVSDEEKEVYLLACDKSGVLESLRARCSEDSEYSARVATEILARDFFPSISEEIFGNGYYVPKLSPLMNRASEYYEYYSNPTVYIDPLYPDKKYSYNEIEIFGFFRKNGFTVAQACAFLANILYESEFNPSKFNPDRTGEPAFGICQWRNDRLKELVMTRKPDFDLSKMHAGNKPRISTEEQLRFILDELNGNGVSYERYKSVYQDIKYYSEETPYHAGEVSLIIAKRYEGVLNESMCFTRIKEAEKFFDHYMTYANYQFPDSMKYEGISTPGPDTSTNPSYISLSGINPYTSILESNLSSMEAEGYKYGYLIDNNTGDEFKFYVPEFSESAGANWNVVDIPGRSVDIHSYSKTNSRKITVSLELYAGEGLYKATSSGDDVVSKMHRDLNFVKSLEYPDYTNVIIKPPSTVHLILGSAVNMIGIVSDVQVEHLKPLDSQNRSIYTKLSFTVTQISADPPGYKEIRGASVGMTSTKDVSSLVGV